MNMSIEFNGKCYICDSSIKSPIDFEINKVFESTTLHSQTLIHILLERFVGHSLSSRIEPEKSDALCQQCINKFDEYDLAVITAEKVQNELLQCFNDTIAKYDELEIKLENFAEHQQCIEFDPLSDDESSGEGSIVIKSEKEDSCDDCSYQDGDYAFAEFNLSGAKKKRKIDIPDGDDDEKRRLDELKVHQHSLGGESEEMYGCDICGQTYKSKTALDIHVGLHKGVSTHVCEVCFEIFTQKEALVQHMSVHSGEKPNQKMNSNGLHTFVAPMEFGEVAGEPTNEPIEIDCANELSQSKVNTKYLHVYNDFKKWRTLKKKGSVSETVLLAYFHELAGKNKPTTLWAYYSMLKATIRINDSVDISVFTQITAYLRSQSSGYEPVKSKIFTDQEIQKFIDEASDDIWLDVKVVCIFGISGALNVDELVHIKLEDIEHHGELLLVLVTKTRTTARSFTITGKFYTIVQKYAALRLTDTKDDRFFVNYRRGRCTNQVIGKNKFCLMPRRIATYLQLPEPERYTGQSFRRSSKTILANTDSWRCSKVAEEYIEDSEEKEDSYDDSTYQGGDHAFDEFNLSDSKKRVRKKRRKIENPDCDDDDIGSKEKIVCDICGQTYKSKTALDIHVGLHKGVSTHLCEVCFEIFTQKEALVQHMSVHSGEKPNQEMNSNDLHNSVAPMEVAGERTNEPIEIDDAYDLLPSKSKSKYQQIYNDFKKWQTLKKEGSVSETVLLAYLHELAKKNKPSSLWAYYSMLKTTIRVNDNVDIGAFTQITAYLKSQSSGYQPVKSKIFTEREIKKFIDEASDDIWLDVKVACIFGISGALNADDLLHIKLEDIDHHGELLLVRISKTKSKARSFTITGKFYTIVQNYAALRHPDMKDGRFFVNYRQGKCTNQVIGKHKFCRMPRRIATYLQLPEPERYTGQSFRSSSKTILGNSGSWRCTKGAKEFIENSGESNV